MFLEQIYLFDFSIQSSKYVSSNHTICFQPCPVPRLQCWHSSLTGSHQGDSGSPSSVNTHVLPSTLHNLDAYEYWVIRWYLWECCMPVPWNDSQQPIMACSPSLFLRSQWCCKLEILLIFLYSRYTLCTRRPWNYKLYFCFLSTTTHLTTAKYDTTLKTD